MSHEQRDGCFLDRTHLSKPEHTREHLQYTRMQRWIQAGKTSCLFQLSIHHLVGCHSSPRYKDQRHWLVLLLLLSSFFLPFLDASWGVFKHYGIAIALLNGMGCLAELYGMPC